MREPAPVASIRALLAILLQHPQGLDASDLTNEENRLALQLVHCGFVSGFSPSDRKQLTAEGTLFARLL